MNEYKSGIKYMSISTINYLLDKYILKSDWYEDYVVSLNKSKVCSH